MSKRRGRGEGGIHWDESRQRFIASVTTGYYTAALVRGSFYGEAARQRPRQEQSLRRCFAITRTGWPSRLGPSPSNTSSKTGSPMVSTGDRWLADKAKTLSTSTLQVLHQCLNRAVNRAMARDQVKRNVVALCSVPKGQQGRPSKSLTLSQATAVLLAAEGGSLYAYIVVSMLTGQEPRKCERSHGITWTSRAHPTRNRRCRPR
jgi:hypothetical protein